jgi:starch phosphorylase
MLLIEDYDLRLARRLVSGVDVWLNNPIHPLEASGTSGMKAGINGVINLSVLDGWWDEGYDGNNGWAIKPASESLEQGRRNFEESRTLYELLQDHVIPLYYKRGDTGYSSEWVRMAKRSMASLLPRFNSIRMVSEYVSRFYLPATRQGRKYAESDFEAARRVADWKARVRKAWPKVSIRRLDAQRKSIAFGEAVRFEVAVGLDGLKAEDVAVELLISRPPGAANSKQPMTYRFESEGIFTEQGEQRYALELQPELCGKLEYRIRIYPHHELLTQRFEMGMLRWL